jgi:NADH-quinone oxidoreductase subunit M
MLTVLLIALPMLAALIIAFVNDRETAQKIAMAAAFAELGAFMPALFGKNNWTTDFRTEWVPALGIEFNVNMTGVGLLMVFLTVALVPLILATANRSDFDNRFFALAMMMQGALVGVFTAYDGFLFYIFWELALIPIWFICLIWGEEGRQRITLKFFIYTLGGSLFMLLGLITLYLNTPEVNGVAHSFDWNSLRMAGSSLSPMSQNWVFWSIFVAFAIKMPIFPFHTWQPDTYTNAPAQGTMLLSGIMLKMGVYGAMVWLLPMAPAAAEQWKWLVVVLSVIGVVYGSIIALQQTDLKRLAAYSSFAHVGLIGAGVFAHTYTSYDGAVMQMLAHGFNVVALFYIIDIVEQKTKTRKIHALGGIAKTDPVFATLAFIVVLGSVAMPLTNAFVGEFMLLLGLFGVYPWASIIAGLTIILGAIYMLNLYRNVFFGEASAETAAITFTDGNVVFVLGTIAFLIVFMGIAPKLFMDLI